MGPNSSDIGVVLLDANSNLEFASPGAVQLLGCPNAATLEEQWTVLRAHFSPLLSNGSKSSPGDTEVAIPELDKRLICRVFDLNAPGMRGGFLLQIESCAQRAGAQRDAIHATQFRTLSCLSRALGHDIRGGLNGIVINLKVIEQMAATGRLGAEEGRAKEVLYREAMARSSAQMKDSLEALLSQVIATADPVGRFDLSQLAIEIARIARPTAIARRITLGDPQPPDVIPVIASRSEVKQAALHILVNAFQHVPVAGMISIDVQVRDERAVLSIVDSGPGISPEVLERLDSSGCTSLSEGLGTGIPVARSALATYGGQLEVRSALGSGTCVDLVLPLSREGV